MATNTAIQQVNNPVVLQLEVVDYVESLIVDIIAFLPRLIGALLILLVGWIIGRIIAGLVSRLADSVELDRMVLDTPLGRMLGGTQKAVSNAFGKLAAWFVYALAILAAADVLAIALLSRWLSTAVSYLPAFIAGLLIIIVGFVVADFIGDAIGQTRTATQTAYTRWFAQGTKMFLYFTAIVIGLDTMGIDVGILFVFARALAWGLGAAIAIGIGVALGWGGKDYVSENIDSWMGRASSVSPEEGQSSSGTSPDIGADTDDEAGSQD